MAYLSRLETRHRGGREGVVSQKKYGAATMMAFVWMDRERHYFIATSSSLQEGVPYVHNRCRQVDIEVYADAKRVEVSVAKPKASEVYYNECIKIDHNNRHRQDTLNLENKLKVHDWPKRVNMTLFRMMVVDAYLAFNGYTLSEET